MHIEYDLLCDDTISAIRGDWDAFASANGSPDLTVDAVLGRSLWAFVEGDDVRALYRMLVEHVRATGKPKDFQFHCDDNIHVRLFRLMISSGEEGNVTFSSTLLEQRKRPSVPLFDHSVSRGDELLTVCSVCKKVNCDDTWLPVEEAIAYLNLYQEPVLPDLSHGLCPDCFRKLQSTMN